ncbi:hypothetical protein Tco_0243152 [Tanacetum coccineum]
MWTRHLTQVAFIAFTHTLITCAFRQIPIFTLMPELGFGVKPEARLTRFLSYIQESEKPVRLTFERSLTSLKGEEKGRQLALCGGQVLDKALCGDQVLDKAMMQKDSNVASLIQNENRCWLEDWTSSLRTDSSSKVGRKFAGHGSLGNKNKERNIRLFKHVKRDEETLVQVIKDTVKLRMMSLIVKESQAIRRMKEIWNVKLKRVKQK